MDKDCRPSVYNCELDGSCALTCIVGDVVATCGLSAVVLAGAFHVSVAHSNPGPDVGFCPVSVHRAHHPIVRDVNLLLAHFQSLSNAEQESFGGAIAVIARP